MSRTYELRVDPVACDGHGSCADLLPGLVRRDEWGYPLVAAGTVPTHLLRDARLASTLCPRLALQLVPLKDR